ncbi:SAF domain-containing protein [Nocardioides sp. NPDC057767]|jgi:hypothetical protein|uniref:SAF domain-containing protein n=2 Tax=Nocardioides TaxID=1839 RepID=A0A543A8B3_9ACTN|nr:MULTISPECIES: SAF domain-containing protein [Nocardioides]NYI77122.1 hypothetical protein [Nocardioides panzhihuensis]TQL68832.1 SAF domain-containing protein [Nocardioides albertanoniae]
MTSTTVRSDRATPSEGPKALPPPKLRRRPWLSVAAAAAIALGAFGGTWVWAATTDTVEVLAARTTIPRGALITHDDLERVRITTDPALAPLPANALDDVVGKRAAYDILSGGLITAEAATDDPVPGEGKSVVGVALTPAQEPGVALRSGDLVRVVVAPAVGEEVPSGTPQFSEAEVVESHRGEDGTLVVSVMVPHAEATLLAARAASGNVALVLDSGVE